MSQFTTTLYNAIWWTGLEDVRHTPHTLYFTRYPMVRGNARLSHPGPAVPQRQSKRDLHQDRVHRFVDHGEDLRRHRRDHCRGITSERRNFTDPTEYFDPDPALNPGTQELRDDGTPGFTADVTRIITYPDGTKKTQKWTWIYDAFPIRIAIHPVRVARRPPAVRPHSVSGAGAGQPRG